MDIHYNAFISYRHHPDDIRVATQIHRLLEHYRIPRALQKQNRQITRLFRDKEELPITSNLSDDINRALANSDYLIVICSTHTRESTWVQREIETFLTTHDRSKILTVLVNGEPYDTIPEILLYEDVVDPKTGETVHREFEPLSCDWRMPLRQAKREELPRLAAALLGCGYDELRRRERQYRMRRMVAGFSAAMAATLCFAAYVIHNSMEIQKANDQLENANGQLASANLQLENANTQLEQANADIQANLNEALINQSQFLASTSERLMEEGDRVTAMLLALEALPQSDGDRPYVAEAERALATALGAYSSGEDLMAAGSFTCDGLVKAFLVTQDGRNLYILDGRNVLTFWDTHTFQRLATVALSWQPDEILLTPNGDILALDNNNMMACYSRDGTMLWTEILNVRDVAFLTDTGEVMVSFYWLENGVNHYNVCFRDSATGAQTRPDLETEQKKVVQFLREAYRSDMPMAVSFLGEDGYDVYAMDLEKACFTLLAEGYYYNYIGGNTAQGDLLLLAQKEAGSIYQGRFADMLMSSAVDVMLQCFDRNTGKMLWQQKITTYQYGGVHTLEADPVSGDISCQLGNQFLLLDAVTGEVKAQCQSMACVLWAEVNPGYTRAVLEDGSIGSFRHEDAYCGFVPCAKDDLICVDVYEADYYVADMLSSQVVVYRYVTDTNKVSVGKDECSYPDEWHSYGNYVALEDYNVLQMVDMSAGALLWTKNYNSAEIVAFSGDGAYLWATANYGETLLKIHAQTGETEEIMLATGVEGISPYTGEETLLGTSILQREICIRDGYAYYMTRYYSGRMVYLFRQDLTTGDYEYRELYTWEDSYSSYYYGRLVAVESEYALVWNQTNGTLLEVSFATGDSRCLAENITTMPGYHLLDGDGTYLLSAGTQLSLRKWKGEAHWTTAVPETRPVSIHAWGDALLALCDDGYLYVFDMDGNMRSKAGITRYNSFDGNVAKMDYAYETVTWSFTADGDLLLSIDGAGNLVDCDTWKSRMFIEYCYAYCAENNVLICKDMLESKGLCLFPLYSAEDIITMAREALNGAELTDAQRAYYGLD